MCCSSARHVASKELRLRLWPSTLQTLTMCSQSPSMKVITEKSLNAKKMKKSVIYEGE